MSAFDDNYAKINLDTGAYTDPVTGKRFTQEAATINAYGQPIPPGGKDPREQWIYDITNTRRRAMLELLKNRDQASMLQNLPGSWDKPYFDPTKP